MANVKQSDAVATILQAVSSKVGFSLTKQNCIINSPTLVEGKPRNSMLEIVCLPESGRLGKIRVYYQRIHKDELPNFMVERKNALYASELLPALNATCGVDIKPSDIFDMALPALSLNSGKFDIKPFIVFTASSWLFYDASSVYPSNPLIAPLEPVATEVVLDVGCHGWQLVQTTYNTGQESGLVETVVDEHSVLCGWSPELGMRGTGWMRFIDKAPANGQGLNKFKTAAASA